MGRSIQYAFKVQLGCPSPGEQVTAQLHFCPVCRQSNAPQAPQCVACETPAPGSGWPVDPHVGKVLGGKYRVESRLGAGGFGTVLLATQLHGEQDLGHVVLKILHADLAQQDNVRRRFVNEARAARQLNSPHAVKVFDLCYDDQGVPFIVMEYLEGQSLADALEESERLPVGRVLSIGRQVAEALAECHAKEIIHRDLKPDNILLLGGHREDFAKLLDFGIARVPSPTGRVTQTLMGTPLYMAPEQIRQQAMDHRVDIFALGVVLFECLAGVPPIEAETITGYITKNCEEAPARLRSVLPEVPAQLDALLDQMMAKSPADRPANMRDVAESLGGLETSAPIGLLKKAPPAGAGAVTTGPKLTTLSAAAGTHELARSLRASERRPWLYVVAGLVALALVGVGYWQLGSRPGDSGAKSGKGGAGNPGNQAPDGMVRPRSAPTTGPSVMMLDSGVPRPGARPMSVMRVAPRRPMARAPARPVMAPTLRVVPRPPPRRPTVRPMPPMDDPFGRVR